MAQFLTVLFIILLSVLLIRLLLIPTKLIWKLLLHTASGMVCLWILNLAADLTGICIPINFATAFLAGALGIPGIAGLALWQWLT